MKKKTRTRILQIIFGVVVFVIAILPVYMIVSSSLKPTLLIRKMPPEFVFEPTWTHYLKIFKQGSFLSYFKNSLIVAVTSTAVSILIGSLAAYGLAIMKSDWANRITGFLTFSKLLPAITIMIPLYVMLDKVQLLGGFVGVILSHIAINAPFTTWLMLGFIQDLPQDLFEAAKLDGCTRMKIFWRVVFPLLSPAIGSAVLLSLQYSWNELMFAMQFTSMKSYTLTVGVSRFVGAISVDWGQSSAAATVVMLPIILVGFFLQKYLVSGLTAGAVKG